MKAFRQLLTHKVTLTKRKRNATGDWEPVETHENVPAFVEWGRKLTVNNQGEEVAAAGFVYLDVSAPFDPSHEYWQVEQTHPYSRHAVEVVTINVIDDPRTGRTHHYELAVK